jgi:hypothetical protein
VAKGAPRPAAAIATDNATPVRIIIKHSIGLREGKLERMPLNGI